MNDIYDVVERVLYKLDKLRAHYVAKHPECQFIAVFDNPSRMTFRHELLPEYKAGRTKHEELPELEASVVEAVKGADDWITIVAPEGSESDDVIASVVTQMKCKIYICSNDRDFHGLLEDGRVKIIKKSNTNVTTGKLELEEWNERTLYKEYGFLARSWIDYQLLVGGKDKVPGWKGVGKKTATELILACLDIDHIEPANCPVYLKKNQMESYAEFQRMLPRLRAVQTLKCDSKLPEITGVC